MTKSTWLFIGATTSALALALVLSVFVGESELLAQPQPPHRFLGSVYTGTTFNAESKAATV